jgi:hypothetical protein
MKKATFVEDPCPVDILCISQSSTSVMNECRHNVVKTLPTEFNHECCCLSCVEIRQ